MNAADREQLAKKNRRRMFEAHSVIDQAPLSANAKELCHLLVQLLGARGWKSVYASSERLALMLYEDFNRKGCAERDGQRGRSTGRRRLTLTGQSVLNRLHAAVRCDLFRIARKRVEGTKRFTYEITPTGLVRDALRGVYKGWRACFDEVEAAKAADERSVVKAASSAVRALASKMFDPLVQVLPEDGRSRAARDAFDRGDRAAAPPPARAERVIAAALEADTDSDRGAADAVARLRAVGILV